MNCRPTSWPLPVHGSKGYLGLLQVPAIYLARNGEAFNIPHVDPPAYPVIPAGATTANREELRAANAAACKAWNTYKMVLTITRNRFAAAINNLYYTVLDNPTEGLNAVDLRTLVMHILNTYAQISQPDLDDNMTDFHSGIDSSLPLAIYMRKQEKYQVFAADARVPISDKTMVTTGTKHALACGNMTWRKWKCPPILDHTWPNWKAHWTTAFAEMRDINRITAGDMTFGVNQAAELEQAQQMLGCIFLQESSGFLCFPFLWRFFHRNTRFLFRRNFFRTSSGNLSVWGLCRKLHRK
jgi:hypothetical protein